MFQNIRKFNFKINLNLFESLYKLLLLLISTVETIIPRITNSANLDDEGVILI